MNFDLPEELRILKEEVYNEGSRKIDDSKMVLNDYAKA